MDNYLRLIHAVYAFQAETIDYKTSPAKLLQPGQGGFPPKKETPSSALIAISFPSIGRRHEGGRNKLYK